MGTTNSPREVVRRAIPRTELVTGPLKISRHLLCVEQEDSAFAKTWQHSTAWCAWGSWSKYDLTTCGCEKGQSERRKARVKETSKEATVMVQARDDETLQSGGNIKMPQLSYLLIPPPTHSTKRTLNLKVFCSWQCRKA